MSVELEQKTQKKVMTVARKHHCYIYKNAQSMYTEVGRPDLTACVPVKLSRLVEMFGEDAMIGLFVGLEVKRPKHLGNVSEAQKIVAKEILKSFGMWFAIDSEQTVDSLLNSLQGE